MRFLLSAILLAASPALAQTPAPPDTPLPDIPTLMHQVEANQRKAEAMQQNYIYKSTQQFQTLKGNGAVKKTDTSVYEVFWLNGVEVRRLLEQDGKPLTPEEKKKEEEHVEKSAAKARARRDKAAAEGKDTDSRGHDVFPLSRYLELGAFSNPRRQTVDGRPTILIDFTGDPKAKTYNTFETAVRDTVGTLWIDEQDKVLLHLDGKFINNFKIGGGLLVNISKDTTFRFTDRKINDEVWLIDSISGNGHIRALLFFATDGDFKLQASDYRKFKATSTISPNFTPVPPDPNPTPTPKP